MIVFFSLIIEIIVCYLFKEQIIANNLLNIVQAILILCNVLIAVINIYITKKINKDYKMIIIFALLIRIIMVYVDQNIVSLPNSGNGNDTESYNRVAIEVSENISMVFSENVYGGIYTKMLAILYFLIGQQRMFAQTLNCFIGIVPLVLVCKLLDKCKNVQHKKSILILAAFFPQGIILSSILNREAIISCLVTLSMYYCIKYLFIKIKKYKIYSYIYIIFASAFHTGVAFLIIGYVFVMTFFDVKSGTIKKSIGKYANLCTITIMLILVYVNFSDTLGNKINNVNIDTISSTIERATGGSAYLTGIKINNVKDIIIYSIPKAIYFVLSPMPWDARNIIDIFTFVTDSLVYGFLIIKIINNIKLVGSDGDKKLLKYLFAGIIICIFVFGIGTYTAGAASRHRYKLYYTIMMLYILTIEKYKNNENLGETK